MSTATAPQHDAAIEARILAACIEDDSVLKALYELEVGDFFDYHHQATFEALRNVQWAKQQVSVMSIVERIEREDKRKDTHVADKVDAKFLAKVLAVTAPYDDVNLAIADAKFLRAMRDSRERGQALHVLDVAPEPAGLPASEMPFCNMPARIVDEQTERAHLAARAMNYHNTFFDDVLRAILPHDLILIGAPTGLGKTDLALSIAMQNAMVERSVAYFALEAEYLELERRVKFTWLASEAQRRNLPDKNELNYIDWYLGRCESIVGQLNSECDQWFLSNLGRLWTFYRGQSFTQHDLRKRILEIHKLVDLIIVDHLHYVDIEDSDSEAHGLGDTVKTIRDVSLRIGKPVILVAHLRKKDERLRKIVPSIDDFHGSSNITKICTQAITIERAHKVVAPKWYLSPTYLSVLKDRRAGAPPFVALQYFDRRTRRYEDDYTLGRLIKGNTDWEQLKPGDQPSWARGHRQLELEFV